MSSSPFSCVCPRRVWEAKHPLGRIASADEVARAILFLASDEASFINGAAVPVGDGLTAA
jgi:meso-butanediol dehydrogenase/(S,S)-butanediol dehydrogenase/diacetyl reductase